MTVLSLVEISLYDVSFPSIREREVGGGHGLVSFRDPNNTFTSTGRLSDDKLKSTGTQNSHTYTLLDSLTHSLTEEFHLLLSAYPNHYYDSIVM